MNILFRKNKTCLFLMVSFFAIPLFFGQVKAQTPSFIDIGLRVNQGTLSEPDIQRIAIEDPNGPSSSPLKIAKNGSKYNIALVNPNDPLATKIHIMLPGNVIKALRKFGDLILNFPDQSADIMGYVTGQTTTFYATFSIVNNSSYTVEFERINFEPVYNETAPVNFTVNPNSSISKGGFGTVIYNHPAEVTGAPYGNNYGSATYSVRVNGAEVDIVTYTWFYQN